MTWQAQACGIVGAIIGGVIGAVVSFGILSIPGLTLGYSLGSAIGGFFWPEKADINTPPPPQPHETRLQFSSWGMAIPIQYGSGRLAGNIIYMSDIVETIERSRHRQDGVRYYEMMRTYTATFAIAFCEGPVTGVSRIWMNNKLLADWRRAGSLSYPFGDSNLYSANISTTIARSLVYFAIYLGGETQTSDPTISGLITEAENPAYRGLCYIVFKDFPIGEFSGVPNMEVEIGVSNQGYCTQIIGTQSGWGVDKKIYLCKDPENLTVLDSCIDLDNVPDIDLIDPYPSTVSHAWTLEANYVLCNRLEHKFFIMDQFSETTLSTFTVPAIVHAGLTASSYRVSGWGIAPNGNLFVCVAAEAYHEYWRRNLVYDYPGGSLISDSEEFMVDVASANNPAFATNYFFEGTNVWEYYTTLAFGYSPYGGLNLLDENFDYTEMGGWFTIRIYKQDGTYVENYLHLGVVSCDRDYFYYQYVSAYNLGDLSGNSYKILRIAPSSIYVVTGTFPSTYRLAVPFDGYQIIRSSVTNPGYGIFPGSWS